MSSGVCRARTPGESGFGIRDSRLRSARRSPAPTITTARTPPEPWYSRVGIGNRPGRSHLHRRAIRRTVSRSDYRPFDWHMNVASPESFREHPWGSSSTNTPFRHLRRRPRTDSPCTAPPRADPPPTGRALDRGRQPGPRPRGQRSSQGQSRVDFPVTAHTKLCTHSEICVRIAYEVLFVRQLRRGQKDE